MTRKTPKASAPERIEPESMTDAEHKRRARLLASVADLLKAEQATLLASAEATARKFWAAESRQRVKNKGKSWKYTPRIKARAWCISITWERKSSTLYRKTGGEGHIGPKWKYIRRGRSKTYPLSNFTAKALTADELAAIRQAEAIFGSIRAQGDLLTDLGLRLSREVSALGVKTGPTGESDE